MLLEEIRKKIVDYGNQLISSGLTIGTAGNISIYDPETGYMAISPSGIPYAQTTPEDVVVMDLQGNVVDGNRKPSSENGLHAAFYLEKPDARAVVHAHSMYCTTLACAGVDLKATRSQIPVLQRCQQCLILHMVHRSLPMRFVSVSAGLTARHFSWPIMVWLPMGILWKRHLQLP